MKKLKEIPRFKNEDAERDSSAGRRGPAQASVARDAKARSPEPMISAHRFMTQPNTCPWIQVPAAGCSYMRTPNSYSMQPRASLKVLRDFAGSALRDIFAHGGVESPFQFLRGWTHHD